ncbi:MAG: paraquat-inducible protein A [Burkholderiaceae bacterium]
MMPRAITRTVDLLEDRPREVDAETAAKQAAEEAEWLAVVAEARRSYGAVTARRAGLYACPSCGLLSQRLGTPEADVATSAMPSTSVPDASSQPSAAVDQPADAECPRCGETLRIRKPASLARTWAYLISAFILYIPANVFPITDSRTLFEEQTDTIYSGVVYLWKAGSWPLALLVFFASIVVPLAKLIVLAGLALSVQRRTLRKPAQRTRLYRVVEFIGRWSMLDIYAVAILTALVQLKGLAEVTAGPGVLAFGAVCVFTILASQAFDPRLIWDAIDEADTDPDEDDD